MPPHLLRPIRPRSNTTNPHPRNPNQHIQNPTPHHIPILLRQPQRVRPRQKVRPHRQHRRVLRRRLEDVELDVLEDTPVPAGDDVQEDARGDRGGAVVALGVAHDRVGAVEGGDQGGGDDVLVRAEEDLGVGEDGRGRGGELLEDEGDVVWVAGVAGGGVVEGLGFGGGGVGGGAGGSLGDGGVAVEGVAAFAVARGAFGV